MHMYNLFVLIFLRYLLKKIKQKLTKKRLFKKGKKDKTKYFNI